MPRPTAILELQRHTDGAFVLNASTLDGADLLALDAETGLTWHEITDDALTITTQRGTKADGAGLAVEVGYLTATFKNAIDPRLDPAAYRPGRPVRLRTADGTMFTGITEDLALTFDKNTDDTFVTLTAFDAVKPLANTTRYGAAAYNAEHEPWTRRVERLFQSSAVSFVIPPTIDPEAELFDHTGAAEDGQWSGSWRVEGEWLINLDYGGDVTRELTGLTPGTVYRVVVEAEISPAGAPTLTVDGELSRDTDLVVTDGVDCARYTVLFLASETTALATLTTEPGYYCNLARVAATSIEYVPQAANIAHETNLAAHLDIATRSAGRGWYVDADNVARIAPDDAAVAIHLGDLTDEADPLFVGYVAASVSFGTSAIVNDLALANLGRKVDSSGSETSTTTNLGPWISPVSAATWGERTQTMTTAIYVGDAYPYTDGPDRLAADYLATHAEPHVTIDAVTVDVTVDNVAIVAALDIYARAIATHRDVTQESAIVAIGHTITPRKWTTVLTLTED